MQSTIVRMFRLAVWLLVASGVTACAVDGQETPPLAGPSGFAQSVTLTATPDQLPRDGSSQAVVTLTVRNESGQPVAGRRLALSASLGTLSQSEVTTGSDGTATVTVTAPPTAAPGSQITVVATPIGGVSTTSRSLSIGLSGTANLTLPAPSFTFLPAEPEVNQVVTFDASGTTDEGAACGSLCSYTWNFDDGTIQTTTNVFITHTFAAAGTYNVRLTVTDPAGATASVQRQVTVVRVDAPTVAGISVVPTSPVVGQQATFSADAEAADGHVITQFVWTFGAGTTPVTTTTPTATHAFTSAGAHVVTVTVTDDVGQTGSAATTVTVTTGVTADFTISPTNPLVGQTVRFDPRASTIGAGVTVDRYEWDFGNGDTATTTPSAPIATASYASAQTFTVRLTIVDTEGRETTVAKTLSVTTP